MKDYLIHLFPQNGVYLVSHENRALYIFTIFKLPLNFILQYMTVFLFLRHLNYHLLQPNKQQIKKST